MERIAYDNINISEYTDFGYYDLCQYWDKQDLEENLRIGRWLGVSHRVGSAFCYWILTAKGKFIASTTVQHVTKDEVTTGGFQRSIGHYHKCLDEAVGRGYHYSTDINRLEGLTNDDVPNS